MKERLTEIGFILMLTVQGALVLLAALVFVVASVSGLTATAMAFSDASLWPVTALLILITGASGYAVVRGNENAVDPQFGLFSRVAAAALVAVLGIFLIPSVYDQY